MSKNKYIKGAKDTMKVGITGMAGYGVFGAMGSIPGMPAEASAVTRVGGAGLQLAAVGQLAKVGLDIMPDDKKKKLKDKYISKII